MSTVTLQHMRARQFDLHLNTTTVYNSCQWNCSCTPAASGPGHFYCTVRAEQCLSGSGTDAHRLPSASAAMGKKNFRNAYDRCAATHKSETSAVTNASTAVEKWPLTDNIYLIYHGQGWRRHSSLCDTCSMPVYLYRCHRYSTAACGCAVWCQ